MHRAAQMHEAVGARGGRDVALKLAAGLRLARGNRDGATNRVAAEQGSLRAAQYFESLNVDNI